MSQSAVRKLKKEPQNPGLSLAVSSPSRKTDKDKSTADNKLAKKQYRNEIDQMVSQLDMSPSVTIFANYQNKKRLDAMDIDFSLCYRSMTMIYQKDTVQGFLFKEIPKQSIFQRNKI